MVGAGAHVRPLRHAELEEAGNLLGDAFADDPLMQHAFPDRDRRRDQSRSAFRWNVRYGALYGHVFVAGDPLLGVAIVLDGGAEHFTDEQMDLSGYSLIADDVGDEDWSRFEGVTMAGFAEADDALHGAVPQSHWYLDAIGVATRARGHGTGSALLDAVRDHAASDARPVALLTFQPTNVPFYLARGFQLSCQGTTQTSDMAYWGFRTP
jgi:GNAT superfamily N-acetyltransferase